MLSDSHGRGEVTRRAVAVLLAERPDVLLHLGDVGSEAVIDALAVCDPQTDRQVEARLVFGNTDYDSDALARYAADLGVTVAHPVGRLALGGLKDGSANGPADGDGDARPLVFCHGHENRPMRQAVADEAAYLCHGHTHEAADTRRARTRVINPGALHRARRYTVALLDTEADTVTFYSVPAG